MREGKKTALLFDLTLSLVLLASRNWDSLRAPPPLPSEPMGINSLRAKKAEGTAEKRK